MYRLEIKLSEFVEGYNHMTVVDPEEFSEIHSTDMDATRLKLKPLNDFITFKDVNPTWYNASEGLKTIRGLIKYYMVSIVGPNKRNRVK